MKFSTVEQNLSSVLSLFALAIFWLYLSAGALLEMGYGEEAALMLFAGAMLPTLGVGIWLVRKYRKAGQPETIDYLNLGVQRYVLGLFMVVYGVPKIYGNFFDYQLFALDSTLSSVSEFELGWYLYGKNPWQELFAGMMELVPGCLLFHRRTYYLGAVLLLPVVAQVFLLNFFFEIGVLTFPIAVVLLLCNGSILWSEKDKILAFVRSLTFSSDVALSKAGTRMVGLGRWAVIGLALLFLLLSTKGEFFGSEESHQRKALVGVYTLESMQKNGQDFEPKEEAQYYKDLYFERQSRWNILRRFNDETDAFVFTLKGDDGFLLRINEGGIGDAADVVNDETALEGTYRLEDGVLTLTGTQQGDELTLRYGKRDPKPKTWFW